MSSAVGWRVGTEQIRNAPSSIAHLDATQHVTTNQTADISGHNPMRS